MGTPEFAGIILRNILDVHEVVGLYTQPDAIRKRGNTLVSSAAKKVALAHDIKVYTPERLDDASIDAIAAIDPDVICVAAYGKIIPKRVLEIPKFGCLNVHASELPKWRGAAPIQHAILAGDVQAGVCVMKMEEGLDTGDYCVMRTIDIGNFNTSQLTCELADLGSSALLSALAQVEAGVVLWNKQDESQVSYAPKITKGQLNISAMDSTRLVLAKVQASDDAHPSKCNIAGKSLSLIALACIKEDDGACKELANAQPGDVYFTHKRLFIAANDGTVEVLRVKPDGKQEMTGKEFAAGVQNIKSNSLKWTEI